MNTLDAIFTRRSIRKFKQGMVDSDHIELIIKAGMYAPTARNTQSNEFIVVNERHLIDTLSTVHPHAQMLKEAPLAIIVCGNKDIEKEDNYLAINGSAATQNILLAVHDLNYGAVWLGVYGRDDRMAGISNLFNLPPHIVPISAIAIGLPNETKNQPDRFNKMKMHNNGW